MGQIGQRVQTLNLLIEIRFAAMWPWSAYKQTQWLDLEKMQKALFSISIARFYMVMSVIYVSSEVPPPLPFLFYSPLTPTPPPPPGHTARSFLSAGSPRWEFPSPKTKGSASPTRISVGMICYLNCPALNLWFEIMFHSLLPSKQLPSTLLTQNGQQ